MRNKLQVFYGFKYNNFSLTKVAIDTLGLDMLDVKTKLEDIDPSRICIFPMPTHYLWNMRPHEGSDGYVFELMKEGAAEFLTPENMYLCFDAAGEGFPLDALAFDNIVAQLGKIGFPKHRVLYLTSDLRAPERYAAWCSANGRPEVFTIIPFDVQMYYYAGSIREHRRGFEKLYFESSPIHRGVEARAKKYISWNYTPRPTRLAVAMSLIEWDMHTEGYLSFHGRNVDNGPLDQSACLSDDQVRTWLLGLGVGDETFRHLSRLDAMSPMIVDTGNDRYNMAYGMSEIGFYSGSYFSIVTETMFESGFCEFRLTEKTWKPIAHCHPFLLVSNKGGLKTLRDLGYRTFSPLIDESYDEIDDPALRFRMIRKEMHRLCSMSHAELGALYEALWPAISHNFMEFHFSVGDRMQREKFFQLANVALDHRAVA